MSKTVIGAFDQATVEASGWTPFAGGPDASVTTDASAAKRGVRGLLAVSTENPAYAYIVPEAIAPGGERILGMWARRNSFVGMNYLFTSYQDGSTYLIFVGFNTVGDHAGEFWLFSYNDIDAPFNSYGGSHVADTDYWMTLHVKRASAAGATDGWVKLFVNGMLAASILNLRNHNMVASVDALRVGLPAGDGRNVCIDDVSVCDAADLGGADTLSCPLWTQPSAAGRILLLGVG